MYEQYLASLDLCWSAGMLDFLVVVAAVVLLLLCWTLNSCCRLSKVMKGILELVKSVLAMGVVSCC